MDPDKQADPGINTQDYQSSEVCLFLSRIKQKLLNPFPPDFVLRWGRSLRIDFRENCGADVDSGADAGFGLIFFNHVL